MSEALIRLQRKGQMVIPRSLCEQIGVAEGSLMKVAVVEGGRFLVTPQPTINPAVSTPGGKNRKQVLRELAMAVAALRQDAKDNGLDKMPISEINRAVGAARRDIKKSSKRPRG